MLLQAGDSAQKILDRVHRELCGHDLHYGHGTDNPRDEANWLLASAVGGDPAPELRLDERQVEFIERALARRIGERIPLAYILGEAWFAGLPFCVDERVLVPRSPIAELILARFEPLLAGEPGRILDLCCGSGCIGIASAVTFPEADVVVSDVSSKALEVAALNVERHELTPRVTVQHSDLFDNITGAFDLIVCNPPYVGEDEYRDLPAEYRGEPEIGLVSPEHGLAIPGAVLHGAADYLTEQGRLILEVGHGWPALEKQFPRVPFLWLEFEHGGEGVCMLTREQLLAHFQ